MKVLVTSTHPIQYHSALWRQLSKVEGLEVLVLYGTSAGMHGYSDSEFSRKIKWDGNLVNGFDCRVIHLTKRPVSFFYPRARRSEIAAALGDFDPDVVILNAYSKMFWIDVYIWSLRKRLKRILRTEASDVAGKRSLLKAVLRDVVLRQFYRSMSGICYIGQEAKRHFKRLNVPEDKLFFSPYSVDLQNLSMSFDLKSENRASFRLKYGIPDGDSVFLFAGKIIDRKNPFFISDALQRLSDSELARVHFAIVGDGSLKQGFVDELTNLLGDRVHYLGFLNQTEIAEAYLLSDFLILPSKPGFHETWGLVVNEAMHFGCIPLVSSAVGCWKDLVSKQTGRVFSPDDCEELTAVFRELLGMSPAEIAQMRQKGSEVISNYNIEVSVRGIRNALQSALA